MSDVLGVVSWAVMALDVVGALGILVVFGLLGSMLGSSISASDRYIGLAVWGVGLVLAAHPILGIWWCMKEQWWWALAAGVPGIALGVGGVWFMRQCIEAAARP